MKTLEGIRVLEFTHAVLGPTTGRILSELGAEVIRVEPAPNGDPTRKLKGFGMGYFPFFNQNKKSLAVNLKDPRGLKIVKSLLNSTDVLVENFGPGTMDRLGLGYEALASDFPELVYCALKGFLPGPYESRTALDEVVQMMSGLAYMTGPPGQPLRAGASVIDVTTGMMGAMAILAALRERDQNGKGQLVRSALFETAAFLMGHHMTYSAVSGEPVPPMPARVSAWAIYHQFETSDGQRVFVGVTSDKQWLRFCEVFEQNDWLTDDRLKTNNGRIDQRDWFLPAIREMFASMPLDEILSRCAEAGLPYSPIARPEDLFEDAQLNEGDSLFPAMLADGRQAKLPRLPFVLNEREEAQSGKLPELGEHTREILLSLGYAPNQISELESEDIIREG
ncbi:MAG: CoA transferase [Chloroflexi bacterium]|nr:CoA transferase [Chloroflexota bacterium]